MDTNVIATVDAGRSNVVVWWTNIRPEQTSSLARNCGAWNLKKDDLETIDALTSACVCLATPTGRKFLESEFSGQRSYMDPNGTLAGVISERQRLEMVLATAKTKTALKPLTWPTQPVALHLSRAKEMSAPRPVQRAIAIARWLVLLSEYWETIEEIRMSRPALRKLGDGDIRPVPLVVESPMPLKRSRAR
jgi:hypothetical protein